MKENHQSLSDSSLDSDAKSSVEPLSSESMKINDDSGILPQGVSNTNLRQNQENRLKFAEEIHQYVREYIRIADQKAAFFFAGSTALLAYLHSQGFTKMWIVKPAIWSILDILSLLATISLLITALVCIATVIPRLRGSKRGLIFFVAIREYESSQHYINDVMRQNPFDLCEAKLKHTYDLSDVCKKKYNMLNYAQWIGAVGVITTLLLLVLQG